MKIKLSKSQWEEIGKKNRWIKTAESHTGEIINKITPVFEKRIDSWYVANGAVGWFKYKDGQIYEIAVSPASLGKYKDLMRSEVKN